MRIWNTVRAGLGVFYIQAAIFNSVVMMRGATSALRWFSSASVSQFYKEIIEDVIIPNNTIFVAVIVLFELATGFLILAKENKVKLGNAFGATWNLILAPALGPFFWINLALVALHALLLTKRFDRNIQQLLAGLMKP